VTKAQPTSQRKEPVWRVALAFLALVLERYWSRLVPALSVAALFAAFAFLQIFQAGGAVGHLGLLAFFILLLGWSFWRFLRHVPPPSWAEARRRLERKSEVSHRPLTTVLDEPPAELREDAAAMELWKRHVKRAEADLVRLRVGEVETDTARRDALGLRALAGLFLAIGLAVAWGRWPDRLHTALFPDLKAYGLIGTTQLDAWINPPDYTGLAPIFLHQPEEGAPPQEPVPVPEGSKFTAHLTGGRGLPALQANDVQLSFDAVEPGSWRVEETIYAGSRLSITRRGREIAAWPVQVIEDAPPVIGFAEPPAATPRAELRIRYEGADDYGITGLAVELRLKGETEGDFDKTPLLLPVNVPGRSQSAVSGVTYQNLAAHPWAGLPVEIRLMADDAAGQHGQSEPVEMVLPEREFRHPVAQAIIAERKRLVLHGDSARGQSAGALNGIASRPDTYDQDVAVFLGLRVASNQLILDRDPGALEAVESLLWDIAVRVEEGRLGLAEQALRDAQQRLRDALMDPETPDSEIDRLMDELNQAMNDYMQALQRDMQERMARGEEVPMADPDAQVMESQDWQEMMERMRQLSDAGARDAARRMLERMQDQLSMLQQGMQRPYDSEAVREMNEMLRDLQDVLRGERELLDKTNRRAQEQEAAEGGAGEDEVQELPLDGVEGAEGGEQGQEGREGQGGQAAVPGQQGQPGEGASGRTGTGGGSTEGRAEQEQIRRQLGDVMRRMGEMMGEIPEGFGQAEGEMRGAEDRLGEGDQPGAVPREQAAIDALQQGSAELMRQMQENGGMMIQMGGRRPRMGRDPFGRGQAGADVEDIEVPKEGEMRRAREIMEELRRRSSQFTRPEDELDYLQRLMRRF
jgi:uncharacterized protein (TIGR02302 family)